MLKAAIILSPLLGFTWIIGLFAVGEEGRVFAYLFVFANVFQVSAWESTHAAHSCNIVLQPLYSNWDGRNVTTSYDRHLKDTSIMLINNLF